MVKSQAGKGLQIHQVSEKDEKSTDILHGEN